MLCRYNSLGTVRHVSLILIFLCQTWVTRVDCHPQCLDFKPPFRPQEELTFCLMYKDFGCCDTEKDQELMTKFYRIMDNFDNYRYATCASYVQELICQVKSSRVSEISVLHILGINITELNLDIKLLFTDNFNK